MDVWCRLGCGLVAQSPAYAAHDAVMEHLRRRHRKEKGPFVQGEAFDLYESPFRCDTCNGVAELPWWQHISTPKTSLGPTVDNDGRWLVCDPCHELWVNRDLVGWVRRHWSVAVEQTPWMREDPLAAAEVRAGVAERYRLLFERFDQGVREEVGSPPLPGA